MSATTKIRKTFDIHPGSTFEVTIQTHMVEPEWGDELAKSLFELARDLAMYYDGLLRAREAVGAAKKAEAVGKAAASMEEALKGAEPAEGYGHGV